MTTLTRVYDTYDQARKAVEQLRQAGIPDADISVVANRKVTKEHPEGEMASAAGGGAGVGAALGGGAGLLAGLGLLAIPGLGPVVAAGWLAATAVGAVGGALAGGLISALVDAGVSETDAHVYSESVRRGGTLLTVRTSASNASTAEAALDRYNPVDLRKRRSDYEAEGWRAFDPNAPEYDLDESERESRRRSG